MVIYRLNANHDSYDACQVEYSIQGHSAFTNKRPFRFDGTSVKASWRPAKLTRYQELPLGDHISKLSSDVVILRKSAVDKLKNILGNVELLPTVCDFGDYWMVNVLDILDCVDYEHSDYTTFSNNARLDGRTKIMAFDQISFLPERVMGYHLFKTIDLPKSEIYVDNVFVKAVQDHSITGFLFQKVWEG